MSPTTQLSEQSSQCGRLEVSLLSTSHTGGRHHHFNAIKPHMWRKQKQTRHVLISHSPVTIEHSVCKACDFSQTVNHDPVYSRIGSVYAIVEAAPCHGERCKNSDVAYITILTTLTYIVGETSSTLHQLCSHVVTLDKM